MMNQEEIFSYLGLVHNSVEKANTKNVNLRQCGTMKLRRLNLPDDIISDKISTCFATKRKLGGQTIAKNDQENVKRSKSDCDSSTDESFSESDDREHDEKMERQAKKEELQRQKKDKRTKLEKKKKAEVRRGKATVKKPRRTNKEKAQDEMAKLKRKEERRLKKEAKEKKKKHKADKLAKQQDKFSNFFIKSNEVQIVKEKQLMGKTLGQPQDKSSDDDDDDNDSISSLIKYFEQDDSSNADEDSEIEVVMAKVVKPIYPDAEKFCPLPFPTDKPFMTIAVSCPRPRLTKKEKNYLDHVFYGMANANEEDNRLKNVVQELRSKKPTKEIGSKSEHVKIKHVQRGTTEILVQIPSFRGEWPAEKDKVKKLRRCPYRKLQENCDEEDIWEDETDDDESDDEDWEKPKDRSSSSSEEDSWSDSDDFVLEDVAQVSKIEQVVLDVSSDDAVVVDPERFKRKIIRTMNKFSAAQLVDAKYAWDKLETKIRSNLAPELKSLFEELLS